VELAAAWPPWLATQGEVLDPHARLVVRAGLDDDTDSERAPRANSRVTRRAETVLPSTFSFPAPSLVLDPVQALCSPERSTFASKRFLRLSLNARPPRVEV
jgi:hypothetical protein